MAGGWVELSVTVSKNSQVGINLPTVDQLLQLRSKSTYGWYRPYRRCMAGADVSRLVSQELSGDLHHVYGLVRFGQMWTLSVHWTCCRPVTHRRTWPSYSADCTNSVVFPRGGRMQSDAVISQPLCCLPEVIIQYSKLYES